ncbi:MAG: hypothetical protein ABJH05_07560 [Fulvivirga sp.]
MKGLVKKITVGVVAMLFLGFTVSTAVAQLRTPSSVGTYEKGTITLENGDEVSGYIYIDLMNPQDFQKRVYLIDEEAYAAYSEGEDVDEKATEYDSKDLQGFTLENGKKFKRARYVNLFAKRKQDKIPKQLLLEVATEGKITVLKKHHHTQGFVSSNLPDRMKVSDAEYAEWQENNFEILAQKGEENPVNLSTINIKKLVGDNRTVLMNYAKDVYGFRTLFTKGPVFESSFQMDALEALTKMVEDYNKL